MTDTAEARAAALAAEPLRIAGPRPGFARGTLSSVRDILAHRELLASLVRRELKARYKDSALGFVWSLARPLAMLLIYYVALGQFLGAARDIPDFAIFIYTGLTAWGLFSESISVGTGSIIANTGLIKKVYLPREVFPLSVIGSSLFNFAIQLLILVAATVVAGAFPTGARWWYFPLSLAVVLVWSTALVLLLSAVNVYLRDVQYLVEVVVMILFWASPIVYSWALVRDHVSGALTDLYLANPMTLAVIGFQQTFWVGGSDQPVPGHLGERLGIALGVGLVLLWVFQRVFARLQSNFAQEL
ncbi:MULTISPECIES: ABC transporter permease [unclassified Cellulomonas]|uniref:ABC transporter permease n=1 Tax=unclassified Cellulomonas TaxID=2620175 RepID=UPI00198645B2|nr:ABC transporter permease [Cellulomonas sp. ES6]MBD3779802.1 ABC transporter permease [Micrococcales bacterium]WHP17190.1 ABC transporter permease [Cellulomonas sp. ES6]